MKPAKLLLALFLCLAAFAAEGQETFQGAPGRAVAANPSQYSFVDVYRVAASAQPPVQFAVAEGREPRLWMLLLAGVAAAVWVARRRLGYAF